MGNSASTLDQLGIKDFCNINVSSIEHCVYVFLFFGLTGGLGGIGMGLGPGGQPINANHMSGGGGMGSVGPGGQ